MYPGVTSAAGPSPQAAAAAAAAIASWGVDPAALNGVQPALQAAVAEQMAVQRQSTHRTPNAVAPNAQSQPPFQTPAASAAGALGLSGPGNAGE